MHNFPPLVTIKWSEVSQLCPTLCNPVNCRLPGSSIHGIFQARVLEWVATSFSRGSSQLRDQTRVSRIVGRRFYHLSHQGSPSSYSSTLKMKGTQWKAVFVKWMKDLQPEFLVHDFILWNLFRKTHAGSISSSWKLSLPGCEGYKSQDSSKERSLCGKRKPLCLLIRLWRDECR